MKELKCVSDYMCKLVISNVKINFVQQHKLETVIRTLHNNVDMDSFLIEKIPIQDNDKTID